MMKLRAGRSLGIIALIWIAVATTAFMPAGGNGEVHVQKIKYHDLEKYINTGSDTLYIINFWATWCKPCVDEMPYFEKVAKKYADKKVKVLLVSVDYPKHYDSRVVPFARKNIVNSEVMLLDEKDPNDWMGKVSKEWGGSIPATLFIYAPNKTKAFYEQEFSYNELRSRIIEIISL